MEREEIKETSRKAEEDIGIIKAVMERTKYDMCEISDYFIWAGIIYILIDVLYAIWVSWIYRNSLNTDILIFQQGTLIRDVVHCILLSIPFCVFYKIIRQKNNKISLSILLIWGIITILLPLFMGIANYFSNINLSFMIDANNYVHDETSRFELISIAKKMLVKARLTQLDYKAIGYILGIFVIGFTADKRNIKLLGFGTMVIYFVLEYFIICQSEVMGLGGISNILGIFICLVEYGAVLLLGIFLKLEGRKKIHGIT